MGPLKSIQSTLHFFAKALAAAVDRGNPGSEEPDDPLVLAREAAEQGGEFFRKVVEATPLAVIGVDAEGRIWLWNPAAERIFGWTEKEVLGRPNPVVPAERREEFKANLEATLRGEFVQVDSPGRVKKGGAPIDMRLWASGLTGPGGRRLGLGIIEDITARRKAEQDTFRAQKMDTVGRLAAGLAHDFNNLLTAISAHSQLLMLRTELPAGARAEVEAIDAATRQAEELTRRLLAIARKGTAHGQVIKLNEALAAFEKTIRPLLPREIEMALDLDPEAGTVKMDPAQLDQILMNLVLNARDAMPDGGRLIVKSVAGKSDCRCTSRVTIAGGAGCALLEVTDTGAGMSPEVQSHLFEPFFTTKESARGSGLGLATVFGIVRQSNGDITVESAPGKGSTFRICLPRGLEGAQIAPAGCEGGRQTR